jgi:anti-sigma-K factor RskA
VPEDPAVHVSEASVRAAVSALAERNRHHLESMTESERDDAVRHWRELALAVLTAASAATETAPAADDETGPGRAVIVLEDVDADGVAVHASFHPELQDMGGGEVAGTPAQIAAIELLEALGADAEGE